MNELASHSDHSFASLLSSQFFPFNSPPPASMPLSFSSEKGEASQGYQPALVHQFTVKLWVSSLIEIIQGSPVREKGSKGRQKKKKKVRQALLLLLEVPHEEQTAY